MEELTYRPDGHYQQALSEKGIMHYYGSNIYLESNAYTLHLCALIGSEQTKPPLLFNYMRLAYDYLIGRALMHFFPKEHLVVPTRMQAVHSQGVYDGPGLAVQQPVVLVDVARAGILPSQYCFEHLSLLLGAAPLRQDHLFMNRTTNAQGQVTGSALWGAKVGGSIEGSILIIADPMGATGETLCQVIQFYHQKGLGVPAQIVALHLMITPEYIDKVQRTFGEQVQVFALRLDRGLSSSRALESQPGEFPLEEKGLTEKDYIVPGAGGMGEVLNNCYEKE